jgi:hypothetical protein
MVRHVLLGADDATVRALASSVTLPTTSIKGFMESVDLARYARVTQRTGRSRREVR